MIELEKHIEILLLTNDCVIVPGLGGFTAGHVPARYDNKDNIFLPPSRTLGFNSKLSINDSLLVQSYSETYDISFPEAFNRLEDEITELKQHIYNEGSYELNDIGTLYLNNDGNIEFTPCEAGLLTPYLYSLSSFEINKLSSNTEKKPAEVSPIKAASPLIPVKQSKDTDDKDVCDNNKATNKPARKKYILFRNTAAIILFVISFILLSEPVTDKSGMTRMSNFDTGIVHNLINNGYKNIAKRREVRLKGADIKKETAKTTTEPKTEKIDEKQTPNKETPYFSIVLASKIKKNNAEDFVRKLEAGGFKEAMVLTEKGKSVKVVYGHYKTQQEAYNALNDLKGNEPFYDAWVYRVM